MSEWAEVVATSDDGWYRAVLMHDGDCESPMDSSDFLPDFASIEADVNAYNEWAIGECYGYVIQERVTYFNPIHGERRMWEDADASCWGFIGYDNAEAEALAALNHLLSQGRS